MLRNILAVSVSLTFIFGAAKLSFAQDEHSHSEQATHASADSAISQEAVNIGNKACPVTGEKIDEKLKATYEYQGKVYNFCCAGCIGEFKKDPDKYIKKVNEELAQESKASAQ